MLYSTHLFRDYNLYDFQSQTMDDIKLETERRLDVDMRIADLPIISELRMLGISNSLIAKQLDIAPNTAAQYMTGRQTMPVKYVPALMRVLDTAINSWRAILREFQTGKHGPMSDAIEWRINHYGELVDYAYDRLRLYQQVWQAGPPKRQPEPLKRKVRVRRKK